ncbi:PTS sugar transporter subunit IIA [Leuconostoc holzapfelii]|uniref:PTS glucose transporter subunit IIA n=1 Tax=Leuconostoc holzapfelii TaxID=434464 RepID=A0A846ZFL5_9LACO|nr:PTS glucose transporter subunit IIA [Leuconostoc holzapfelii]NKZ17961.1 PTS glucose transporter subunit IIA [Leuconostoc holzapfelii]
MFGFEKKPREDINIYAPVTGEVIPLEKVSDPVFAQKMMGDGYAVIPTDSEIVAPIAGKITLIQGHAVGLQRFDGLEVLLHIGIDTVSLNGKPFTTKAKVGQVVAAGDVLVAVDWAQIDAAQLSKMTMVLITNTTDKLASIAVQYGQIIAGQQLGQAIARRS